MALAVKPALFLVTCVALMPAVAAATTAVTLWWWENRYLPTIAGED